MPSGSLRRISVRLTVQPCVPLRSDTITGPAITLRAPRRSAASISSTELIPAYVARKLGQNLKIMHLNDNYGIDDDHIMPYTGGINWSGFALALKEIGYKGDYCAEIDGLLGRIKKTNLEFTFDVASTNCKLLKKFREEVER